MLLGQLLQKLLHLLSHPEEAHDLIATVPSLPLVHAPPASPVPPKLLGLPQAGPQSSPNRQQHSGMSDGKDMPSAAEPSRADQMMIDASLNGIKSEVTTPLSPIPPHEVPEIAKSEISKQEMEVGHVGGSRVPCGPGWGQQVQKKIEEKKGQASANRGKRSRADLDEGSSKEKIGVSSRTSGPQTGSGKKEIGKAAAGRRSESLAPKSRRVWRAQLWRTSHLGSAR